MIKAHKIRLNPTEEQKNYFARAAGVARFVGILIVEQGGVPPSFRKVYN